MGGLWVDYNLMTNIPGLYAVGEANFSDHGANRLGASSLMQCLADGYFVLPQTIGDYLHDIFRDKVGTDHPEFARHEAAVKELDFVGKIVDESVGLHLCGRFLPVAG